jgi:surfeit locus 1 family protein
MNYRFRKPELAPTVAVILVTALMLKLGFWQVDRLEWKTALLANIEKAQSEPPRPLLSYSPAELAKNEWHNVIATGRLLNDKELYATPRYLKEQIGYGILTPLAIDTPSGTEYVLVNRGWVPSARKDPSTRAAGNPDGPVTVEGVIRVNVERGWIWHHAFQNSPEKNIWLWYDLPAMQAHTGLKMLPILIDAARVTLADGTALKDGPTPFPLEINIRNDHLGYAITWFLIGLSGVVIYGAYYLEKVDPSSRRKQES